MLDMYSDLNSVSAGEDVYPPYVGLIVLHADAEFPLEPCCEFGCVLIAYPEGEITLCRIEDPGDCDFVGSVADEDVTLSDFVQQGVERICVDTS